MELIGAFAAAVAVGSLILALAPRKADPAPRLEAGIRGVFDRSLERSRDELAKARLSLDPRTFLALQVAAPIVLGVAGLGPVVPARGPRPRRRPFRAALVRPLPHRHRGARRGGRRAAGPAGDGQPGRRRRRLPGPVRGRGRSRSSPLGEGRLQRGPGPLLRERGAGRGARRDPAASGGSEPRARLRRAHRR